MKHVIFYSWQSDLDPALTRNFIEEALARAVKSLNRDDDVFVEAVIDRDTSGVAARLESLKPFFRKSISPTCSSAMCRLLITPPRKNPNQTFSCS